MTRYVTPAIFAATTAYIAWYNGSHTDRQLLVPFVEVLFPDAALDPLLLGQKSIAVAGALTALMTVWAVVGHVMAVVRQRRLDKDLE